MKLQLLCPILSDLYCQTKNIFMFLNVHVVLTDLPFFQVLQNMHYSFANTFQTLTFFDLQPLYAAL